MNELVLKISGDIHIEQELELGQEVSLSLKANVVKTEHYDQQDGTIKTRFVVKTTELTLEDGKTN